MGFPRPFNSDIFPMVLHLAKTSGLALMFEFLSTPLLPGWLGFPSHLLLSMGAGIRLEVGPLSSAASQLQAFQPLPTQAPKCLLRLPPRTLDL